MELVVDTNIVFSAILGGRTSKVFAQAIININMHTIDTIIQELQHNIDKITR